MAAKKTSNSSKNKVNNKGFEKNLTNELILIGITAVFALLFLSNFGLVGVVGNFFSKLMFGLNGMLAYVFPVACCLAIIYAFVTKGSVLSRIKLICAVLEYINISVLFSLTTWTADEFTNLSFKDMYNYGSVNHKSGGFLANMLAKLLVKMLDKIGAYMVCVILILIMLIVLTGKSLIKSIRNGSVKAIDGAGRIRDTIEEYGESFEYEDEYEDEDDRGILSRPRRKRNQRFALNTQDERKLSDNDIPSDDAPVPGKTLRRERKASDIDLSNMSGLSRSDSIKGTKKNKEYEGMHEININEPSNAIRDVAVAVSPNPYDDYAMGNMRELEVPEEDDQEEYNYGNDIRTDYYKPAQPSRNIEREYVADDMSGVTFNSSRAEKQTSVYDTQETPVISRPVRKTSANRKYKKPSPELLNRVQKANSGSSEAELKATARTLCETLDTFGVKIKNVSDISQGPSVTRYELQPEAGVRVNRITQLSDDIKYALAAVDIRIEAPIPGKSAVGIEVPNKIATAVQFRELIESREFREFDSKLAFAVGKDISGHVVVTDIAKMPHMLIAGATGSGKSVCINTIIMSILYKANPDEVKLIMIDPKVVELSVYNGIPHLMVPVVTDPKKAAAALHWAVAEMTDRYNKFASANVRDLKGYNAQAETPLPQIVIIVDELADLMMVAAKEVEESICRLAQLARACGIHLIIATQRPSVDVITGLIKANMPSRVAFAVSSGVDSRTILDMVGAEKLLGKGDMLFNPQGYSKPARVQGAFVSDGEVNNVATYLREQNIVDSYQVDIEEAMAAMTGNSGGMSYDGDRDDYDDLIAAAGRFIIDSDKASIGALQRKFKIGFNRAARIMDQLAELGVVSDENGTKARTILMGPEQFDQLVEEEL